MYVGMNRNDRMVYYRKYSVPHVRGDEPIIKNQFFNIIVRSPCTWG